MGQLNLILSVTLIALFTFAFINFIAYFQKDNDSSISISNDSDFNYLNNTVYTYEFSSKAENSYISILGSEIEGGETTKKGKQFDIGLSNAKSFFENFFDVVYRKIFGSNPLFFVFINAFISLFIITFVLYIWKVWKQGWYLKW